MKKDKPDGFKTYRHASLSLYLPTGWAERERERVVEEQRAKLRAYHKTAELGPEPEPEPDDFDSDDFVFGVNEEADASKLNKLVEAPARENKILSDAESARKLPPKKNRDIQIFDKKSIEVAKTKAAKQDPDFRKRALADLENASKNDGKRTVPETKNLLKSMRDLTVRFPNFKGAIDALTEDFALSSAGNPEKFYVAPVLLDGVPGIGKTAFSQAVAEALDVPFLKISAGGLQNAAQLCGTASHWSNSATGLIFDLLGNNESAVAIVLIDEVDKLQHNDSHPVLPAFLELLEPESSRRFVDASLNVIFDASKLIFLMTSNEKDKIDKALLSRASIHQIQEPDEEQRRNIAIGIHNALRESTGKKIVLDAISIDVMAKNKTDLRAVSRSVRSGFAKALLEKKKVSRPVLNVEEPKKGRIGF